MVRSLTKFQTPRIIISGRSRVPVGGGGVGGGWCKVIIVSNPTLVRLSCVVLWLGWGFDKNLESQTKPQKYIRTITCTRFNYQNFELFLEQPKHLPEA